MKDINIHEWQRKYIKESVNDVTNMVAEVTALSAEDMEGFLFRLGKYFESSSEELTNMDARTIGKHLIAASQVMRNRTGN